MVVTHLLDMHFNSIFELLPIFQHKPFCLYFTFVLHKFQINDNVFHPLILYYVLISENPCLLFDMMMLM